MLGSLVAFAALSASPNRMIGFTDLTAWEQHSEGSRTILTREVDPGMEWDEMVPSWNAITPGTASLSVEVQPIYGTRTGKFYSFGVWRQDPSQGPRESKTGQRDADGDVLTDTLQLGAPAAKALVRLTLDGAVNLKLIACSFTNTKALTPPAEPNKSAWGSIIEVPERAQMSFPNGSKICSPTAVSMILGFWSNNLGMPEMDPEVPAVCDAVMDPQWPGTGNWPFNTAYAGSFDGMVAYVARLTTARQLEDWIEAGIPVATSVAYDILRYGERRRPTDGHLLVLVGFSKEGDPIFNDPAVSEQIRQTYTRALFVKAWAESHNTVYLIYPRSRKTPVDQLMNWITL